MIQEVINSSDQLSRVEKSDNYYFIFLSSFLLFLLNPDSLLVPPILLKASLFTSHISPSLSFSLSRYFTGAVDTSCCTGHVHLRFPSLLLTLIRTPIISRDLHDVVPCLTPFNCPRGRRKMVGNTRLLLSSAFPFLLLLVRVLYNCEGVLQPSLATHRSLHVAHEHKNIKNRGSYKKPSRIHTSVPVSRIAYLIFYLSSPCINSCHLV